MNEALHFYKNNKKIMSITGYAYPIKDLKFKESIALSDSCNAGLGELEE